MNYDAVIYVCFSVAALGLLFLLISWLSDRRAARKRKLAMLPDYDLTNPMNSARMTRPGVGEVDENGFTRLW